jgi:putative flippase GtrA
LFVGAWASLLDFGVFMACMHWLAPAPVAARLVALVVSGAALFVGNRSFAFNARAGSLSRQTKLFVVAELVALPLNLLAFRLLVSHLSMLGPALSSQLANFLIFVAFAYPVRYFVVFRVAPVTAPLR